MHSFGKGIEDIAKDLKKQVLEHIMECRRFAVQLHDSTSVSDMSQLKEFARFWFSNEID